ncbi:helix-turn-helix transcriptional regulator [Agromyces sp. MMS24-K17]|uniref:helix-turn-helix transcriptional regulator n=1 Tax=Agromyces sp. MMS24-K17 TaxID=3372850 RepID=UPI0037551CB2
MSGITTIRAVARDAEATERELDRFFPGIRLGSTGDAPMSARIEVTAGSGFTVVDYAFQAPGGGVADTGGFTVVRSAGHDYRVGHGSRDIDNRRSFLAPREELGGRWASVASLAVVLDRAVIERVARVGGSGSSARIEHAGIAAVGEAELRYWDAVLTGFRHTLAVAPEAFASPLVERAAVDQLAVAFLHAFPTTWQEGAIEPAPRAAGAVVRRAIELMEARAGEPITVADVAAAVFISPRGLHYAFTRELGETPSTVLRGIRLRRARADLLAAGPGSMSITEVARRWGFAHPSRFTESYRRAFGESPAETLGR